MRNLSYSFLIILLSGLLFSCSQNQPLEILILSGSNNHEWQNTTPILEQLFNESGLFLATVTEKPDTLKAADLQKFKAIVSNWNSWPENDLRWPEETEQALLDFVKNGGGLVTFHAATSVFYKWPEFREMTTGAWEAETWHRKDMENIKVFIDDQTHPITAGLADFVLFDELWLKAGFNNSFTALGSATNATQIHEGGEKQAAIFLKEFGKGRIFHTMLGHDERAMGNINFQALMLRAAEWAATGKVTQNVQPQITPDANYSWAKTDSSFALMNGGEPVWKYNFNEMHGRPFFHPVFVGANNITCLSPTDHPWHLGQWFSWKFINGVNYWEFKDSTFKSEGITEITNIEFVPGDDFSAEIKLNLVYHPQNGKNVLAENRTIKIAAPQQNEDVSMDYYFEFEALADKVDLDRTPILGERDGMSWGGYSGLSIRFNQSFSDSYFISSLGKSDSINGTNGDWLFMGFTGWDGNKVGSQIMVAPGTKCDEAAWYTWNTADLPFYYFSPAYLYHKNKVLLKGEKLKLKYRIKHYSEEKNQNDLEKEFQEYSSINQ